MAIIEKLKQGNNNYFLNKQPTIITEGPYQKLQNNYAANIFKNYYTTPPYLLNSQKLQTLGLSTSEFANFTELHNNTVIHTASNLSDSLTSYLSINPQGILSFVDNTGFIYFWCNWQNIYTRTNNSGTSSEGSIVHFINNLYQIQLQSNITFTDDSIKFRCFPIFRTKHKYKNINTNEISEINYYALLQQDQPVTQTFIQLVNGQPTEVQNVVGYTYKITASSWETNKPIDTFTNITDISLNYNANTFKYGINFTSKDYTAPENCLIIQSKADWNIIVAIKIPNFESKAGNNTPYEYLCNSIAQNSDTKLSFIYNRNEAYSSDNLNNDTSESFIIPQSNINYLGSSKIYKLENSEIVEYNKNDFVYFTQSEIDSIFNS